MEEKRVNPMHTWTRKGNKPRTVFLDADGTVIEDRDVTDTEKRLEKVESGLRELTERIERRLGIGKNL